MILNSHFVQNETVSSEMGNGVCKDMILTVVVLTHVLHGGHERLFLVGRMRGEGHEASRRQQQMVKNEPARRAMLYSLLLFSTDFFVSGIFLKFTHGANEKSGFETTHKSFFLNIGTHKISLHVLRRQ